MARHRVTTVIGTRPEAIKMAPVIRALRAAADDFETIVLSTAQHREMLDSVLAVFEIRADVDLNLMRPNQSLGELTCRVIQTMEAALRRRPPDLILVQGDTTTVFATALAAFYLKIPVAHVEAGLRSNDIHNPFPEEVNRHLTTVLTQIHLAPTELARRHLLAEAVPGERIVVTGNTVVDALTWVLSQPPAPLPFGLDAVVADGKRVLLVTSHRRESWGEELQNICLALRDLVQQHPDVAVVYPVHLNPQVRKTANKVLAGVERVHLTEPLDYLAFVSLMRQAYLILTDSGGIQEESPTLRRPALVLRKVTERPEAYRLGVAKVIGTSREEIVSQASRLLEDRSAYERMAAGGNPYGDGRAAGRIVTALRRWFRGETPLLSSAEEFQAPARKAHTAASS